MLTVLEKKLIKESICKSITIKRNIEKICKLFDKAFGDKSVFQMKDEKIIAIDDTIFELAKRIENKYGYDCNKYPIHGCITDELCYWLYSSKDKPAIIADKIIELLDEDV